MVHFTNIVIKDGYIEADVWNESNGVREHIRAKLDGSYHSSSDGDIQKATWGLVVEYRGKSMPSKRTVCWG